MRTQVTTPRYKWALTFALLCIVLGCITHVRKEGTKVEQVNWQNDDFSWIRGANYVPTYARNDVEIWEEFKPIVIDRELRYAERVGINSVRVFLQIIVYEKDPERFLTLFEEFVQLCEKHGIKVMPVLFDSCFGEEPAFDATGWVANPGNSRVSQDRWPGCEKYIKDVVGRHATDPRIALWDIMNEPMVAGGFTATEENREKVWRFVRHFCRYVGDIDPVHATTVGVSSVRCLPFIADAERVISIHSYWGDEEKHRADIIKAKEVGQEQGKAVILSETGHYATGQPYAMALDVCREQGIGWYIWELMIGVDPFPQVQGIFYPDGSIRSPDDVCAVIGFKKRAIVNQVFTKRRMSDEELQGSLKEASTTQTREWNIERRLALLHSGSLLERLTLLRLQQEKPGITLEEIQKRAHKGDTEDLKRYQQLLSTVTSELHKELGQVKRAYREGNHDEAYKKVDKIIMESAARPGSDSHGAGS